MKAMKIRYRENGRIMHKVWMSEIRVGWLENSTENGPRVSLLLYLVIFYYIFMNYTTYSYQYMQFMFYLFLFFFSLSISLSLSKYERMCSLHSPVTVCHSNYLPIIN